MVGLKLLRAPRREVEHRHWWFVGRRMIVRSLAAAMPRGLKLDTGCGYRGAVDGAAGGETCVGLDIELEKLRDFRLAANAMAVCGSAEQLPFLEGSFAAVLLLDVLEHLRNDWLALSEAFRVLRPGGMALVTVPAFPSLWSRHDDAEMHLRRYSRDGLVRLCEAAAFRVLKAGYLNVLLFPLAAAWRVVSRRLLRGRVPRDDFYMPPGPVNLLLAHLFAAERALLPGVRAPFGLSAFALCTKPCA